MGRSRSTIYREIERNTGGRGYRPKQAQRKAQERRLGCRREPKMSDPRLKPLVTRLLKKAWSPDQIAKWLRRAYPRSPERHVSHQTIYTWIAQEAPELRAHLRRHGKRRSGPEKRGQLVGCTSIEGRPKVVDSRRRFGDWEGDTIVSPGRRSGLVTMVDLGADACIPCKMMAPILDKLEKTYRGKAAIVLEAACNASSLSADRAEMATVLIRPSSNSARAAPSPELAPMIQAVCQGSVLSSRT